MPGSTMNRALRALILLPLLTFVLYTGFARGADGTDGSPQVSCPDSCDNSRKNCELSCSQIVGGGVESGKKRECYEACANEEVGCDERCLNPTPRPTLKPESYSDETCAGACEFRRRDCIQACTRHVGGGAASVERANCETSCGEALDKCNNLCANPAPPPSFDPQVFEDNPCSGTCAEKLGGCEGNCSMFSREGDDGGKRGECMRGCKDVEYNCLSSCPR
jgi:hypothetical protein